MKIYTRIIMTVCLCGSMALGLTLAQATTGSITGAVTDQTGAVIAGAMVTVRNTDTNIIRTGLSNEIGLFSFPALPIGNYEVTIEQGGFGKLVRGPVVLTLNQTAVVNAELRPAGVTAEIVTISDDAPIVNTANAEVGVRFDSQRLSNLPTQGNPGNSGGGFRDVFSAGLSAPGVSQINQGNTGFSSGTDYSVNGARLRSNNFTLDGQDVNEPGVAGVGVRWNNPDAIQEFRMITNQFSAEYGRASGSVIAVATKSGTNTFHGSASWYHNSNPFNSLSNVDKAAGITKAPWRIENQFGGTFGGPIIRNKTFFFGSLQRWTDRQLGAGSTISSAPTAEGRSILQANGGSRITTAALLSHLPVAEGGQTGVVRYCFNPTPWAGPGAPPAATASGGGFICAFPSAATQAVPGWSVNTIPVGSLTSSNIVTKDNWQWSGRGDHTFNAKHSLSARYMYSTTVEAGDGQATPKGLANVRGFPVRRCSKTSGKIPAMSNTSAVSVTRMRSGPPVFSIRSIPAIRGHHSLFESLV